jgi:hypothetical protein
MALDAMLDEVHHAREVAVLAREYGAEMALFLHLGMWMIRVAQFPHRRLAEPADLARRARSSRARHFDLFAGDTSAIPSTL